LAIFAFDPHASYADGRLNALYCGELLSGMNDISAAFDRWLLDERARLAAQLKVTIDRRLELRGHVVEMVSINHSSNNRLSLAGVLHRQSKLSRKFNRNRLRIGVLSFAANGTEAAENLAFALGQEIIAALAQFRWFDVTAGISFGCTQSVRKVDDHQLRCMDLDYLVDGTVIGDGRDAKITIRLLHLEEDAREVWSKHFTLGQGVLHQLNELVAEQIVGRIDPVIPLIENDRKSRTRFGTKAFLLRAIPLMFSMEREKYQQAGQLINQALRVDPGNSELALWAAYWHHFNIGFGWTQHTRQAFATVQDYALRAIKLDPNNAEALGIYAHYCSLAHSDFDAALYCFDRSLRRNPSLGYVWGMSASTYCYIGEPAAALERLERCRELTSFDLHIAGCEVVYTIAYTFSGDYERAAIVGRRVVKAAPEFVNGYKPLIASLGHLGRRDEAKPYVDKLLTLEPDFTAEGFGQVYPFKKEQNRKRYLEGLRLAGVPAR
jgi:adenylate cyclase